MTAAGPLRNGSDRPHQVSEPPILRDPRLQSSCSFPTNPSSDDILQRTVVTSSVLTGEARGRFRERSLLRASCETVCMDRRKKKLHLYPSFRAIGGWTLSDLCFCFLRNAILGSLAVFCVFPTLLSFASFLCITRGSYIVSESNFVLFSEPFPPFLYNVCLRCRSIPIPNNAVARFLRSWALHICPHLYQLLPLFRQLSLSTTPGCIFC